MRHRIHTHEALTGSVTIAGEEFHHAARAVRIREGEEVELFDGAGNAAAGVVQTIGSSELIVRVERSIDAREAANVVQLAMAIINLDKFELVLQKATELGVKTIIPLETERQEIRPERYRGKHERWQKIIFEATKQCGRAVIAKLEPPAPFDEVIQRQGAKILFDADTPATQQLSNPAILFIGPEGGWSEREIELAKGHGCAFEQLGPRRLRAETAAIVACARHTGLC